VTPWYRRWPFLAGIVLILVTNAVVLGGALYNRSGEPESRLNLMERELQVAYGGWRPGENSAFTLRLEPRVAQRGHLANRVGYGGEADWLDGAKLDELGIQVRQRSPGDELSTYSTSIPADVFLVLEMNGPAYRRQLADTCDPARLAREERAKRICDEETHRFSRLFIVDAGLDRAALRTKYSDAGMYAIVHGQIQAVAASEDGRLRRYGRIRGLSSEDMQVPPSMRAAMAAAQSRRGTRSTGPFEATVAFGRRLEPWLVRLSARARED
jgi:Domain of unknown function (DUF4824)